MCLPRFGVMNLIFSNYKFVPGSLRKYIGRCIDRYIPIHTYIYTYINDRIVSSRTKSFEIKAYF